MNQITYTWTGDAPAAGDAKAGARAHVVAIPKVGIRTPDLVVGWPPGNDGLLHPRLSSDRSTFAGTGLNDHDTAWEWTRIGGWASQGPGYGPKSVIYVGAKLHVVRPSPAGPYGYRHVNADGSIVTAAQSRSERIPEPRRGLFEFTAWPDVVIGQLDDEWYGGGLGIRFTDDGVLRRLAYKDLRARGQIRDVVVDRAVDDFAIVAPDLDQHRTTITYGSLEELHLMPPAVLLVTTPPVPPLEAIPAIGRPLWVGFFMFANGPAAPGNCTVAIRRVTGRQARPFVISSETIGLATGDVLGHWVGVEHIQGTVADLEGLARATHAAGYRPIAYWDGRIWPRRPALPAGAWVCVQAYRGAAESREDYEASVAREVARVAAWGYACAIIPPCYTSNTRLTSDLASVIPICVRIARDYPHVVALLPFHASSSLTGRATGLEDHPEVRPLWTCVADATATPPFPIYPPAAPPAVPPVRLKGDLIMFAKFTDPATKLLAVMRADPVPDAAGVFTLILAPFKIGDDWQRDRVFSCQGDGSAGHRDPGTRGGWERCTTDGGIATFQPTPGVYVAWPFVKVAGL